MLAIKSHHRAMLGALVDAGGSGSLDSAGRICVGSIRTPIAGDPVGWLVLMSHGLIAGERGLIIATEDGRKLVSGAVEGHVREASGQ